MIAGNNLNLDLTGDLLNSGTIVGRQVVSLTAQNLHNLGGRVLGNDVAVQARTDLSNIGGMIAAHNNLTACAGRDDNLIAAALRLVPSCRECITRHDQADALLIAWWGVRQ